MDKHTYELKNGQYIVTRHAKPTCLIVFDFKTVALISFFSENPMVLGEKEKLVKKARAFLKAQVNYQAFKK